MTPRVALAVAGLVAFALALPTGAIIAVAIIGLIALGYSVFRPGGAGPTFAIAAVVLTWLDTPSSQLYTARLVALALAVSVMHSSAALAALVPTRSHVPAKLLLRWLAWAAAAAAVGTAALGVASRAPRYAVGLPVTAIAVVAAALGGALVVALARR